MLNGRTMNSERRSQSPKMIWWSTCSLIFLVGCALAPILKVDVTETQNLPRSPEEFIELTKNIICPKGKYPQFVTSSSYNKTYIVCWINQTVHGTCWEYNEGGKIVQSSVVADCTKYPLSPCKSSYPSTDSYKIFECFEKYGGMLSPRQQAKMLQDYQAALLKTREISEKLDDCTTVLQNTSRELIDTLGDAKQEAKKHQDCKEDLESTKIQRNIAIALGVVVLFSVACGLPVYLKRKKLLQLWTRWRNKKNSTKDDVNTKKNRIDMESEKDKNEPEQLDKLIDSLSEPNDCQAESVAVAVSEESKISTTERDMSIAYLDMSRRPPLQRNDIDKAFAKQQETTF